MEPGRCILCRMRCVVLLFCLVAGCTFGFPQEDLRRLIDEMPTDRRNTNLPIPVTSDVPDVLGALVADTYIGISDPAMMDSLQALNQAYVRAVFMYALKEGNGKGMTDFFRDDFSGENGSNYEELFVVPLRTRLPLSQCNFKSYSLTSGEVVVLLTVDKRLPAKNARFYFVGNLELYAKELSLDGANRSVSKVNVDNNLTFSPAGLALTLQYRYLSDSNGKIDILSTFNGIRSDFDNYRFFYRANPDLEWMAVDDSGTPVYRGLWSAFLSEVVRHISKQGSYRQVRVKKLADRYLFNRVSLNREIGTFDFSVAVQRLILKDNSLYVLIQQ